MTKGEGKMNSQRSRAIVTTAVVVLVADQLTKFGAQSVRGAGIVPMRNPDYSLGLVSASPLTLVLGSVALLAAFGIYAVRRVERGSLAPWACGLLIGGAASNLVDRVLLGAVRDFLATPWVVFNVADVAVVIGVLASLRGVVQARAAGTMGVTTSRR
jgi:lipoprotein signal peptidase